MASESHRLFDDLLDRIVAELPPSLHELLEELPLIVEDEPSDELLASMGLRRDESELCGLHWGIDLTRRSVEHSGRMPDQMHLFRGPILRVSGYRSRSPRRRAAPGTTEALAEQIRITLLHEIGHHFGLDEDDLTKLGYG